MQNCEKGRAKTKKTGTIRVLQSSERALYALSPLNASKNWGRTPFFSFSSGLLARSRRA
jgi:hypothetical protein